MTPARRERLQAAILHACAQARPGTLDRDLAEVVGVTRPQISRVRSGERKLDLDELVALLREFGARPVLGPLAELDDADIVTRSVAPAEDPVMKGIELSDEMTGLSRAVAEYRADGVIQPTELEDLVRRHRLIGEGLEQLLASHTAPPPPAA